MSQNTPTPYPVGQLCVVTDDHPTPAARGSIVRCDSPAEPAQADYAHVIAGYISVGELLHWCVPVWAPTATRPRGTVPAKWLRPRTCRGGRSGMSKQPRTWKAWAIVNGDDLMPAFSTYGNLEVYKSRAFARHRRAALGDRVVRVTITEEPSK